MSSSRSVHTEESIHSIMVKEHNDHVMRPPRFTSRAITKYIKTRFTTLVVPKEEREQFTWTQILNPFGPLTELTARQWNFFFVGFWAWTWDAFDFFAVSLNVAEIAESFGEGTTVKDVTWGITLVLMLRTVGALIFGFIGDRWGRKVPYVLNLALLIVLQIGCGFVKTYKQFLGVRAIFGIAMGGVFGISAATSLEDCPKRAHGVLSGIFQQGYAFGYLLVVIFQRAIVDNSSHGWRAIFWFSAGPPVLFILWRLTLPETDGYLKQKAFREKHGNAEQSANHKLFSLGDQAKKTLKTYWLILIYCVLMMSGFNFMSHGSQDLYPTLLKVQLNFGADRSTVTNSVANLGAMFGGFIFGHLSTFIGRRTAIILAVILGGATIYPWAFVRSSAINAGAFFLQAGVQGAWGVVPIHLSELSPPQYRAFVTGVAYQLGNLCSSASSTIESTIGERFPLNIPGKTDVYDYAKVMSIFMGCVFGFMLIIIFIGPENRNASFDADRDEFLEDEFDDVGEKSSIDESIAEDDEIDHEKPSNAHTERV